MELPRKVIVRLENSEDVWDKEVSNDLLARLEAADTDDLFRDAPKLLDELMKLPSLPFNEDREYEMSFLMY